MSEKGKGKTRTGIRKPKAEVAIKRLHVPAGTKWQDVVGYSRAVRVGNIVEVAGTTAVDEDGAVVGGNSPYEQTKFVFKKIEKALASAGASMKDVVRTRMFVTDISRWEEVGRAHGEYFMAIRPVATMVEVKSLIAPELFVEIEVTAIIGE